MADEQQQDMEVQEPWQEVPAGEALELGVIAEVNRILLHPRGLALAADPDAADNSLMILRSGDPEGIRFGDKDLELLLERHAAFDALLCPEREAALGYVVQPLQ